MKNVLYLIFLLSTTFLMTSCFDIVEEIDLNRSGAGKIKLTLNFSKSKTKVASIMKLDKIDGIKVPSESQIRSEMNNISNILKNTKGISNVNSTLDFSNYIATLSCNFSDIEALNTFTKTLSANLKTEITAYSKYSYSDKTKIFARSSTYNADAKKLLGKLNPENQKSFQDAFYTSIYRFDSTISKQQNGQAKVAGSKKAVMLKANVIDILNGKINLSNTINLN